MKYLKQSFSQMEPYFSKNIEDGIILNANESPFAPPKEVMDIFYQRLPELAFHRYPDMQAVKLCETIAKHFGVSPEEVVCGVGSDELLEVTFKAVLEPKDTVISFSPSFSMYKVFADLALTQFKEVYFHEDYTFNVIEMISCIQKFQPKLVLICSPNNPTGAFLPEQDVRKIVESTDALVLLDLAYIDFAEKDYTYLAKEYDNLIVFRTFSKAMALPSIRVGYAISQADNIRMIYAVKAPYSVTTASQLLAGIALEHYELYLDNINYIKKERQRMTEELKKYVTVYPSSANFLFVKMKDSIYQDLLAHKIYIRKIKDGMYRITIGLIEENNSLLKVVMNYAKQ